MSDESVGVYVHVPFCERVCPYCDFAVVATRDLRPEVEDRCVDALIRELGERALAFSRPDPALPARSPSLASIYLGGGTPSLLRPAAVERLIAAIREHFSAPLAGPPEVTLEVNPSTLERERLPGFQDAGVNRLSIGVQSFDDDTLRRLGRAHRAKEAHATLEAAREAGFDNLSLDLIFAAPGQTLAAFEADLDATIAFGPEHVSSYALTLEEGTPFERAARSGRLTLPDDDAAADMMERLRQRLRDAGLAPYEISSHARPGREAVHNQRYWQRRPVLGVGVGAWSTEVPDPSRPHGARRSNERSYAAWLARIEAGEAPPADSLEVLDAATARGEALFLALRTQRGLEAAAFAREFGGPPRAFQEKAIQASVDAGLLLEDAAGNLQLSERGVLLADAVFTSLLEEPARIG